VEGTDSRLDRILADGRLIAVVQTDFPPFSFVNESDERVGFDVDLVHEFARRWLDDASAVDLLPVPSPRRIPTLVAGDADLVAAALTRTAERDEQVDFSLTYFKDGQRLLVTEGAEITSVCDLEGKPVAAIAKTTSFDNYLAAASECGFDGSASVVAFDEHEDAVAALVAGDVAAFTGDSVALERFAEGGALEVVGNHFSEEPYAVAVREGDRRLQELVDATLLAMEDDGTFAAIYERWFGDSIAPYPLEEAVIDTDLSELEPLLTSDAPAVVEAPGETREVPEEYVVEPGDSLSEIAGRLFGDVGPNSWRRLYEANRDVIGEDPSRLEVGMVLTVPR
jgi:ABC-type amino acid transport substrate-binding protein